MRIFLFITLIFLGGFKAEAFWGFKNCYAAPLSEDVAFQTSVLHPDLIEPYMPGNGIIYAFAQERCFYGLFYTYLYAFDEMTGGVLWWQYVDHSNTVHQNVPLRLNGTDLYCFTKNTLAVFNAETGEKINEFLALNDGEAVQNTLINAGNHTFIFSISPYILHALCVSKAPFAWKQIASPCGPTIKSLRNHKKITLFYDPFLKCGTHYLWHADKTDIIPINMYTNHHYAFLTDNYLICNECENNQIYLSIYDARTMKKVMFHQLDTPLSILYGREEKDRLILYIFNEQTQQFEKWDAGFTDTIFAAQTLSENLINPHAFVYSAQKNILFGCTENYPFIFDVNEDDFITNFYADRLGFDHEGINPLNIIPIGLKKNGDPVTQIRN